MHPLLGVAYRGAGLIANAAVRLAPAGNGKAMRSLKARRGIRDRFASWGRQGRNPTVPLVWVHAPSVGEGLQARPVLERLRQLRPALQLAYTFFSPSAERFARDLDVDFRDYLPFDTSGGMRAAIEALRPNAIVFSKLDVWPALVAEAKQRGVALALISATLPVDSGRRGRIARALLHGAYSSLDAVGAIDPDDALRLVELGVKSSSVVVTGDTRYDQVWARAQGTGRLKTILAPLASDRPTLVAGSTWPSDEEHLLPAWDEVLRAHPRARLVIAPHEPIPAHLAAIERWAKARGKHLAPLDAPDAASADVVLVDRMGVLGDLYALAQIAYVGGGFSDSGLHSVLEPAAFGAPVIFGPRYRASRDATLLLERRGGVSISSAAAAAERIRDWLEREDERRSFGAKAQELVREGLGAVDRTVALVRSLAGI